MEDQTTMKALNLSHKQLSSIPEEIFTQGALEEIWLEENLIKEIPADIVRLSRLKSLSVYKNHL